MGGGGGGAFDPTLEFVVIRMRLSGFRDAMKARMRLVSDLDTRSTCTATVIFEKA